MPNSSDEIRPLCNSSSLLSTMNTTYCNTTTPMIRPPLRPPLRPCYTCTTSCIFKAIELVYIIGVLANILIVTRVVVDKKLRKPTFVAIACLAISDALFVICELVLAFELVINALTVCPTTRPRVEGYIFLVVNGICWFAANGHLTLLAVVRFLLIVFPIKAQVYLTIKKVIISSVCIWVLGIIVLFSIYVVAKLRGQMNIMSPERTFILWIIVYLVPFILTCILHLVKLRVVRKLTQDKDTEKVGKKVGKSIKKMTSLILLILFCAFVFPIPKFVYDMFVRIKYSFPNFAIFRNISVLLFYLNNTLNPFIYAWFSPPFRRSIRDMLRCKKDEQNEDTARYGAVEEAPVSLASLVNGTPVTNKRILKGKTEHDADNSNDVNNRETDTDISTD